MIKAIETVYNGYRFRSRLEARWAVFFDAVGEPWFYEYQGFDLDGSWYLPDFYLPGWNCYIEAKDPSLWYDEGKNHLITPLFDDCQKLSAALKSRVILQFGGFGNTSLDPMFVFLPGFNLNCWDSWVFGFGAIGMCKGIPCLYLESIDEPPPEAANLLHACINEMEKYDEVLLKRITDHILAAYRGVNRRWLVPLCVGIGTNFAVIKANDCRVFAPFSEPLFCQFNSNFLDRFKPLKDEYTTARQVRFGKNGRG